MEGNFLNNILTRERRNIDPDRAYGNIRTQDVTNGMIFGDNTKNSRLSDRTDSIILSKIGKK